MGFLSETAEIRPFMLCNSVFPKTALLQAGMVRLRLFLYLIFCAQIRLLPAQAGSEAMLRTVRIL